jgi:broad specificity phosphatase PhoE
LRELLAYEPVELGVSTRLLRTQETLDLGLGSREVPRLVLPDLDEIDFGSYEGGPLGEYRTWAWTNEPDAPCPGGGESRVEAAERYASALDALLARPESSVLAVSHALPIRYVLDAADGSFPAARIERVPHAVPYELDADALERAAETLRVWATAPRFADAPA